MSSSKTALAIWTVYDHPSDYPEFYVARLFKVTAGRTEISNSILLADSLDRIRSEMRYLGLTCMARHPYDDSKIVETWF